MTRYLLDTNIVSEIMKRPAGVLAWYAERRRVDLCTSIIVLAELEFWLVKRPSSARRNALDMLLMSLEIVAFEQPAQMAYATVRGDLERRGVVIGGNDMLIAAHALSLGLVVVTDNEGEFRRVPGLVVENWLRESGDR